MVMGAVRQAARQAGHMCNRMQHGLRMGAAWCSIACVALATLMLRNPSNPCG